MDQTLIKYIVQTLNSCNLLISHTHFSFSTPNDAALTLFVNILFSCKYVCVSQYSIFSNKVDLSQETVLLFEQEVQVESGNF